MWGNRLGWILSVAIVALIVGAFTFAWYAATRTTPPSEFSRHAEYFEVIELPGDPAHLLSIEGVQQQDAGRLYWEAIKIVRDNAELYEEATADTAKVDQYVAVQQILEAAHYVRADIFQSRPDAVIKFGKKEPLNALARAGGLCMGLGIQYAREKNYEQAKRYLTASYILGLRMYQDRQCRKELDSGLGLMAGSVLNLAKIAGIENRPALQQRLEAFHKDYVQYDQQRIKPVERAITSIDPKVSREHVGDVFKLTQESKEKVWRIESIMRLGMYKYNSPLAGDRLAALRMIREFGKSDDPAIQVAAIAARDLTVEEFHRLGTD